MIFDETLTFTNKQLADSTLKIQVYDQDTLKSDDLLGEYEGILTSQQVESQVILTVSSTCHATSAASLFSYK